MSSVKRYCAAPIVGEVEAECDRLRVPAAFEALYVDAAQQAGNWGRAHFELSKELDRLRAEVARLGADARRYRWLRDLARSQDIRFPLMGLSHEIDATVDAAMAQQEAGDDLRQ